MYNLWHMQHRHANDDTENLCACEWLYARCGKRALQQDELRLYNQPALRTK